MFWVPSVPLRHVQQRCSLLSCPQNVAANTYHERVVSGWPIALRLKKGKKKQTRKEVRKEGKENRSKIKCLTYSINLSSSTRLSSLWPDGLLLQQTNSN